MLDAHLHLCDDLLYPLAESLILEAKKAYINELLCVVTNSEELKKAFKLKKTFPDLKIAASTTPHEAVLSDDPFFDEICLMVKEKKIDAIGETGLEYFHPGLDRGLQKQYLKAYVTLACDNHMPLVFHCRDAFDDLIEILTPFKGKIRGMVHCFTGTYEEAKRVIDLGLYISISGIVTFKNSHQLQVVVSKLPLSSILIETDSPYLAPLSQRGKTNRPLFIKETYQKVAQLKNVSVQELEHHVHANFHKIFNWK
jgi:TatD DNase family protein